ncbi:mechanosensitive ion channel protein MscS [Thiocystis violacea]|nr:mechanosensitive ion channel protein MscS [Thiocystis violacea]
MAPTPVLGQGTPSATPLPTKSQLDSKLEELGSASGMDETLKTSLSESYRRAQSNLEDTANFDAETTKLAEILKSAPEETRAIQKTLEKLSSEAANKPTPAPPDNLSTEEISQRLNGVAADVAARETRVNELEKLIDASHDQPTAARERLLAIRAALDALDGESKGPSAAGESPELAQARGWMFETRRQALWAEARMHEQALLSQSARESLFKAQRDLAALEVRTLKARQRALEEALSDRRKAQAEAEQLASERAQRDAEDKHPLVRELILENAQISDSLARAAKQLEGLNDERSRVESEHKRIEDDYRGAKQRLEAVGLSKALGQVLLDRRNQLPDPRQYRAGIRDRENQIAEATLRQIRYREEERLMRDPNRHIEDLTAADASAQTDGIRAQIGAALQQRKRLITQALKSEEDYIRHLGELNYASERVVQTAADYDTFLAERLLWVRSATALGADSLASVPAAIAWVFGKEDWKAMPLALGERIQTSFLFWTGLALGGLLTWKTSAIRRAIRSRAEPLRRVRTDGIGFTLQAIGLTLLLALPLPLLLGLVGQQLQLATEATTHTRAFGAALVQVAFGLYYLRAFRNLCISGGVADRHFRWGNEALARIRRDFDWFTLYVIPISLITVAVYHHNDAAYTSSLGRLTLILSMLGFAVFFARLLNPGTGALKGFLAAHPQGWLNRLRHLWFPLIVGAPLALAALAVIGYVYTAGVLFQSLVYQLWLVLALVTLHQTIVRWLILTRRRLALQAALDRQAARRAQAEGERSDSAAVPDVFLVEEAEPDLAALDERTRRLINTSVFIGGAIGLWATWSEVLPAFSFLEHFALWHSTRMVDGVEQAIPVTVSDIGLVLAVVFVATIAARNLPALLEILLLQSPSVSAGARYTIKTLSSYLIAAVAFMLVFSTLGLSWGKVQWLVAALGVGIGFGLQEIVANFISGLIILFERPVRVGDIVTIGDTTGVVTNIRIRATTIRNWDKQELLVPNKEFITDRLLNWTLTDQQNRITIKVGIEYGSDTKKALELLAGIAEAHERVLEDPEPLVSFEGFADSSLSLVLRCYLDSLDGRIGVITDLHQAIYETFAEQGLQIAFPQRDVRLHTQTPMDVRLHRDERPGRQDADGADSLERGDGDS